MYTYIHISVHPCSPSYSLAYPEARLPIPADAGMHLFLRRAHLHTPTNHVVFLPKI